MKSDLGTRAGAEGPPPTASTAPPLPHPGGMQSQQGEAADAERLRPERQEPVPQHQEPPPHRQEVPPEPKQQPPSPPQQRRKQPPKASEHRRPSLTEPVPPRRKQSAKHSECDKNVQTATKGPPAEGEKPRPAETHKTHVNHEKEREAQQQQQQQQQVSTDAKSAMGKAQEAAALTGLSKHEVQPLVRDLTQGQGKDKDKDPDAVKSFSPLLRQVLVAAGPVMATVSSGMTTGYSAVLLPQLRNSTITLTSDQESWIASMAPLPMALGCILAGLLLDRLGRKRSLLFICLPFTIGWVLLAVARDLYAILGGRFLTGLCVGLVGPPGNVYISETSGPEHRGLLLAGISLAVALGILVSHVLGTVLHWRLTAWLSAAVPVIAMGFVLASPESPTWLASKGKLAEAVRAFRWLRGYDDAATMELQTLLAKHGAAAAPSGPEGLDGLEAGEQPARAGGLSDLPLLRQLLHRSFLKPFFIVSTFFLAMQFSGVNAVAFYSVTIVKDVGGGIDEYVATIILDVVRFIMSCAACVLLRRVGRRPLAVLSAIVTGISLVGLAALLTFGDPAKNPWLPIGLLVLYITAVSLGLVPLPWVMSGEVFPANLRGFGGGATSALGFFFLFAVVKTAPALFDSLTPAGAFGAYGCVALVGSVFLYAFLPETKNRTLQEIEDEMTGSKKPGKGDKKLSAAELP